MPIYLFESPTTREIREVLQGIDDPHIFSEGGVPWQRVYTVPYASIDTRYDEFSVKDFSEKTKNKKGTVGDLIDAAKEASLKREKISGKDPLKQEYFRKWSAKRKGKRHPLDKR